MDHELLSMFKQIELVKKFWFKIVSEFYIFVFYIDIQLFGNIVILIDSSKSL